MRSLLSEDDFSLLMTLIERQYMFSDDMPVIFKEHTMENNQLKRDFEFYKKIRSDLRQAYDPKEDPFDVNITSTIKVK